MNPMQDDLEAFKAAFRRHPGGVAVVTFDRGGLVVEDLTSLNGTFVNRVRLHPGQQKQVQNGDVVQIGTVQMKVVM